MNEYQCIADDVKLGPGVKLSKFINLYGCEIGAGSKVGSFVEIQKGARVGELCKISSHSFICEGVSIGDGCFVGHGVVFINDKNPRAVTEGGELETDADWQDRFLETVVGKQVTIGSSATIMGGISIGDGALIGAGAVITKDVPPGETWVGNPARKID